MPWCEVEGGFPPAFRRDLGVDESVICVSRRRRTPLAIVAAREGQRHSLPPAIQVWTGL